MGTFFLFLSMQRTRIQIMPWRSLANHAYARLHVCCTHAHKSIYPNPYNFIGLYTCRTFCVSHNTHTHIHIYIITYEQITKKDSLSFLLFMCICVCMQCACVLRAYFSLIYGFFFFWFSTLTFNFFIPWNMLPPENKRARKCMRTSQTLKEKRMHIVIV